MALDDSACFELDCCPPGNTVPPIVGSRPLLVEASNTGPYPSPSDSLTDIQTELFASLLT